MNSYNFRKMSIMYLAISVSLAIPIHAAVTDAEPQSAPTSASQDGFQSDSPAEQAGDAVATPGHAVEFVDDEAHDIDEQVATMSAQRDRSIQEYERTIERLMGEYGVYDDRLAEQLLGMGITQQRMGNHLAATNSFEQSLHLDKVNNGLEHLQQAALMELLIDSYTALGEWERVDAYQQYLYWLHLRAYGESDPRLIPVLTRLGRWHMRASELATESVPLAHLRRASKAFRRAVNIGEAAYGLNDVRLLDPLYGFALGSYYVAASSSSRGANGLGNNARNQVNSYEEGLARAELVARGYREGRTALQRMADIHAASPETAPEARGIALTLLADWYLLFNRQQNAREAYQAAYAALVASGVDHQNIQQFFSRPKALPTLRLSPEQDQPAAAPVVEDNEKRTYALASFYVTRNGRPRNIQILESQPADDTSLQRRARRAIRSMRFRPRMENGMPVPSAAVNMRYVIAY